jgi:hypothetical protein
MEEKDGEGGFHFNTVVSCCDAGVGDDLQSLVIE